MCTCRRGYMGKTCVTPVLVLTITIAGDFKAATKTLEAKEAFETNFESEVAASLGLDSPALVRVLEMKAGSSSSTTHIVVTFELLLPEDEARALLVPFLSASAAAGTTAAAGAGGTNTSSSSSSSSSSTTTLFAGKNLVAGQVGGATPVEVDRVARDQSGQPIPDDADVGGDSMMGVIIGAAAGGGGFVLVVIIIVVAVLLRRRRSAGRSGGGAGRTTANVVVGEEGMEMVGQRLGESHGSVDVDNPLHTNPMFQKRSSAGMT